MPTVILLVSFILLSDGASLPSKLTGIWSLLVNPYTGILQCFSPGIHVRGGLFRFRSADSTGGWIRLLSVAAALTTLFAP
jgi:hypothetical protein